LGAQAGRQPAKPRKESISDLIEGTGSEASKALRSIVMAL
jgi:hypothetical protein